MMIAPIVGLITGVVLAICVIRSITKPYDNKLKNRDISIEKGK